MARETTGTGQKLVVGNPVQIGSLGSFTWCCWVYPHSGIGAGTNSPRLISKALNPSTEKKRLRLTTPLGGRRVLGDVFRATSNASAASTTLAVTPEAWQHLAMTYSEADGIHLFKNGVELSYLSRNVGSGATDGDSGGDLTFFNEADGQATLDGHLAEIGIWERVLTGAELNLLGVMRYRPTLVREGLVGCWPILGVAAPEPDRVNGSAAEVIGAVPAAHPPDMVAALPERLGQRGSCRGMLRRMG